MIASGKRERERGRESVIKREKERQLERHACMIERGEKGRGQKGASQGCIQFSSGLAAFARCNRGSAA
jgi:hypothetical protein